MTSRVERARELIYEVRDARHRGYASTAHASLHFQRLAEELAEILTDYLGEEEDVR